MNTVLQGARLKFEAYTTGVYVESPPSEDLPIFFDRTFIPSTDTTTSPEIITLRARDTIVFEDDSCAIRIAGALRDPSATTSATDIQVKSSAHQPIAVGPGAAPDNALADADTEDEDDDLDATVNTPRGNADTTPATSRPTDSLAVKDTPSRPFSRESNHIFSTAPDKIPPPNLTGAINAADYGTPVTRAGATGTKRSEEIDSQFVFPTTKAQTTYGGTPAQKRSARKEIMESPSKSDGSSEALGKPDSERATMSSPNRKRSLADEDQGDDDDDLRPASTAPSTKRRRGRPAKEAKQPTASKLRATKKTKGPGQPEKDQEAEGDQDEAIEPPSSTGKLKRPSRRSAATAKLEEKDNVEGAATIVSRRKPNSSPDLDPRASSTPQSSGAPMTGKAPSKVLLSKSKFAEDSKAKHWLKKHGAPVDESIPSKRSNFVCVVGTGELATTAKMVLSLALGKRVVTDQWLKDSMQQDQLLELDDYVHDDLADTMHINRSKLLSGKALFVTPALAKAYGSGFAHIKELAAAVGAHRVESGPAHKATLLSHSATIFLGLDGDDPDAQRLKEEDGRTVYQKDLLTQSIIRGELLTDGDEFMWKATPAKGKKGKK